MDIHVDEVAPQRSESRVLELEETLRAIHHGEADAVVVSGPEGDRVFILEGADHAYRVMVESIDEGAATLTSEGLILFVNRRFAEMLGVPAEQLLSSRLHDIVRGIEGCALDELLHKARNAAQKQECDLLVVGGKLLPTHLSLTPLQGDPSGGICLIAMDLTGQRERQAEFARAEAALRHLSGRLLSIQDEERRRIARDLHDCTGQTLTVLGLKLGLLSQELGVRSQRIQTLLEESSDLARQASTEIRDLAHLLHPLQIEQVGLRPGLEWHLRQLSEVSGLRIDLSISPEIGRLPVEIEIALFRVIQESLENVRRHSGSGTASVRIFCQQAEVILEVEDRGRGMPAEFSGQHVAGAGIGLIGMRERLLKLGGRLEVTSSERGTLVRAVLPLPLQT